MASHSLWSVKNVEKVHSFLVREVSLDEKLVVAKD